MLANTVYYPCSPIHSLSVGSLAISHFKRDSPKPKFRHHSFNPLYSSDNGDITEEDYFELSSQVCQSYICPPH